MMMHIDMDAFFAAIEQQVNPRLRGKPVIIGGRNNAKRSIICAASYEAKARGIKNAMPSWRAFEICPEAIFVPADTAKYVYTSEQIYKILQNYSPRVEKYSIDEFFLEIEPYSKTIGSLEEVGYAIKLKIKERFGINATVGIAPTRVTAKLIAKMHKPDGLGLADRNALQKIFLTLPVEKLCGVGDRLKERLNGLGVETCCQLAQFPGQILKEHFGVVGLWLKKMCQIEEVFCTENLGQENSPPKSIGHSQTLKEASGDEQYIKDWIYLLSEMVALRLRAKRLQARTVYFYLSDGFYGGWSKRKTFYEPTHDGYEIYHRCLHIVRLMSLPYLCARGLAVSVSTLSPADTHYLFIRQVRRESLLKYLDMINERYGQWTIFPAALKNATY